jgi:ubiquinone/menaquinone biosynthesis C-methylase UbiE
VTYQPGDVTALDLPDASFDGVRAERVLQHVAEPDRAVAELVRVTRPGGRVCLVDTDWESITGDGIPADLAQQLRDLFFTAFARQHRDMGRTLRGRLVAAGLSQVTATPVTMVWTDPVSASSVVPTFNRFAAEASGLLPEDLARRWFAAVDEAAERDGFLVALTMWVATGTR